MSGNEANSCYRSSHGQPQHETRLPRGKRLPISQRLLFRRKDDLYKGVELRLFGAKSNTRTKKKKTSTPESWTHSHFNPLFFLLRPHWQKYKTIHDFFTLEDLTKSFPQPVAHNPLVYPGDNGIIVVAGPAKQHARFTRVAGDQ